VTQGANGTVSYNVSSISYTPNANFYGMDSFSYTISDGKGGTDSATVSVTVANVNDAPIANNDQATIAQNSTGNLIDVLVNDSDLDGDSLNLEFVVQPAHGTVSISANKVSYTPETGYSGTDSFEYTVSDGNGGTASATVDLIVIDQTAHLEIDITTSERSAGKNIFVKATAIVTTGIPNASVRGVWSGAATDADIGTTDAYGNITLVSNEIKYKKAPLQFTFTVTAVTVGGIDYILEGELQDTISYPQ